MSDDEHYMRLALDLARNGEGYTAPNPMVGALVVRDGVILGSGYHEKYGEAHAERNAIEDCQSGCQGATLYVTLEPCAHYGKQPPCTDLIISAGIRRVVIGSNDPNPLVSGKGVKILREHGIEVNEGVLKAECDRINEVFFHYITTGLPFIALKFAMSLDGKTSTSGGESKWITSTEALADVHTLRGRYSAIMCGIGTLLSDDPLLTCRSGGKNPVRIIADSHLRTPLDSAIVKTAHDVKTMIATCVEDESLHKRFIEAGCQVLCTPEKGGHIDLALLLKQLGERGIDSILVEGGSTLASSFLEERFIDRVYAYIAPTLFGGRSALTPIGGEGISKLSEALHLVNTTLLQLGPDIRITGEVV